MGIKAQRCLTTCSFVRCLVCRDRPAYVFGIGQLCLACYDIMHSDINDIVNAKSPRMKGLELLAARCILRSIFTIHGFKMLACRGKISLYQGISFYPKNNLHDYKTILQLVS